MMMAKYKLEDKMEDNNPIKLTSYLIGDDIDNKMTLNNSNGIINNGYVEERHNGDINIGEDLAGVRNCNCEQKCK